MVTRLGLYGGPRSPYGSFAGKGPANTQISGSTGFSWAITGDIDSKLSMSGSTGFTWTPTGDVDVRATLGGTTGFTWTPSGNLSTDAELANLITLKANFETIATSQARFLMTQGPHIDLEDGTGILLLESGDELLMEDDPNAVSARASFEMTTTVKGNFGGI